MRLRLFALCAILALLALAVFASAQPPSAQPPSQIVQPPSQGTAARDPTRVPNGMTFVQLDQNGVELHRWKAGQRTSMTVDCVQVNCPDTFGKGIVCWKCKAGLTAP